MTKLTVDIQTSGEYTTREPNPDDSWDRGDYRSDYEGLTVKVTKQGYSDFDLNVNPGDTVYVILAIYSDGDTFGNTEGYTQAMNIFTDYETAKLELDWMSGVRKNNGFYPDGNSPVTAKDYGWFPWIGYFSGLEDLRIVEAIVQA